MNIEGYTLDTSGGFRGNSSNNEEYRYSNIDEEDFCLIRFYKIQHYQDPTPYSFDGIKKPWTSLQERSIKVFGRCCWRVFT